MTRIYIYGVVALALLAALWWFSESRYNDGREYERTQWYEKMLAKDQEMADLRRKHADESAKLSQQFEAESRKARSKIAALIEQNKALRDWWESRVPADAVSYAWGVSDGSDNSELPGRSKPVAASGSGTGAAVAN